MDERNAGTSGETGARPDGAGQSDAGELSPAEMARDRRRDRDAQAGERAGMNAGLGKQFKQVLDVQRKRAEEADRQLKRSKKSR